MEPRELARRAEIARRLKAARWLAAEVVPAEKPKLEALSPQELARRAPLPENAISANKIGTIERMERRTPPYELRAIAEALGQDADYFSV